MPSKIIVGLENWNQSNARVFAERLVRGLTAQGHDTRILLTGPYQKREETDDIQIDELPAGPNDSYGIRWNALVRYLEENAPCVYIMPAKSQDNFIARRLSDRIHLIGLVQDDKFDFDQAAILGYHWNAIVTTNDVLHFSLVHQYPPLASRVVTINNAVPSLNQLPDKPEGILRIAYSGELRAEHKRLDDLVKIAFELERKNVDYQLTIIGDGPIREELESQTRSLIESGKVRFLGDLTEQQRLTELETQHAFIITSEFEAHPTPLLEAMSRGCVPVVSKLATQSLVVKDGVNAFCAPIGDVNAFVNHLSQLTENPTLRHKMAQSAFQTIADGGYRVEDMVASYLSLFDNIEKMVQSKRFVRWRGYILAPPTEMGFADHEADAAFINRTLLWPNEEFNPNEKERLGKTLDQNANLKDYKVIIGSPDCQMLQTDGLSCQLVRQLLKRGINAKIVGARELDNQPKMEFPNDIPHELIPIPYGTPWFMRWEKMADYLQSQGPCIYLPCYDYEYAGVVPQLPDNVKVIGLVQSDDLDDYERVMRLRKSYNAIIGVSQAITEHIIGLDSNLKAKLHTISYGVELPPFNRSLSQQPTPLRIVYVGKLANLQKRVFDLIEIAEGLETRQIPFIITIVGDGRDKEELQAKGQHLIQQGRLSFATEWSETATTEVLRQSDVFLLPSAYEGCPIELLEAMANGVVPVATRIRSGVRELINDGENGLLTRVGDIEGFVTHLINLYQNPKQRYRMSEAAYQTAKTSYDWEAMTERYVELFQKVIATPFRRESGPVRPPVYLERHLHWREKAEYRLKEPLRKLKKR